MPHAIATIFVDTFTGVTGTFFGFTKSPTSYSGTGTTSGNFDGETSSSSTGSFSGTGPVASSGFNIRGVTKGSYSGSPFVGSDYVTGYDSPTHHEVFYNMTDVPCAICCMIPDSFCLEIKVCGHIHRTRLRKGYDPTQPGTWKSCEVGDALAFMICDQNTGNLILTVETVEGNGFPMPPKLPASLCPFYVEWNRDTDAMPGVRCGPVGSEPVEYVKLYPGSCFTCPGGDGYTEKTVTSEHHDCCAVCTCCALQPGTDKLYAKIDAFGCDFNGATAVLEAAVNDCTWKYTISGTLVYPNCPDIYIEAKCVDGHWQTKVVTDALLDCNPEPFKVIKESCDPFRVESISTCMAAV